jgi:hypothetical protein
MAEKARKLAPTTLLILLAVASFAAAAVTITNITEWHVQSAGTPPIVKVAGADVDGKLISVTTQTGSDGTNRTIITIKGYTGDPTYYSEVIKICNKGSKSYDVKLVYKGYSGDWTNVKYLTLWLGSGGPQLKIDSGTGRDSSSGSVSLQPGGCISVPAEVLVDANTPTSEWNKDLITIEVDVVSTG